MSASFPTKPAAPASAAAPTVPTGAVTKPAVRKSVAAIVNEWAADLTPQNAPDSRHKGPLAWVREVEVARLIRMLSDGGYK